VSLFTNKGNPVEPKPAASVLIIRSTDASLEVFLIRRNPKMKFLGGYHAFPGGKIEPGDISEEAFSRCRGINQEEAKRILNEKHDRTKHPNALGFWTACIREVFEETGLLYCYDDKGNLIQYNSEARKKRFQQYQVALNQKELKISDILIREDLYYAVDQFNHFNHFVTPDLSPIRFDTHFFIARLILNQEINPSRGEIASSEWMTPQEALRRYKKGEIKMILPQISCLKKLARGSFQLR